MAVFYWIEYDENSCAWLVDVQTSRRIALEHGMILEVGAIQPTLVPLVAPSATAERSPAG